MCCVALCCHTQTISATCRAVVGVVAGWGRIAYHKYKVKRNSWPKVRGVAMNVSAFLHSDVGGCSCHTHTHTHHSPLNTPMVVATINTLASHPLSRETPQQVERSVSLLQEELADFVEEREPSSVERKNLKKHVCQF